MVPKSFLSLTTRVFCGSSSLRGIWFTIHEGASSFVEVVGPEFSGTSRDLPMLGTSAPTYLTLQICYAFMSCEACPNPFVTLFLLPSIFLCSYLSLSLPPDSTDLHGVSVPSLEEPWINPCLSSGLQLDDISQEEVEERLTGDSVLTLSPECPAGTLTEGLA